MSNSYKLKESEKDIILYASNEICTAQQYLKLIVDAVSFNKLSKKELKKYINSAIESYTNGLFLKSLSIIKLRLESGFDDFELVNESEIVEVKRGN